jgi:chemotaxis protein histidine kinase CheA/ActR/RegA family two-component response regulator
MEQKDRILGYFLEEADQHLDTIEQGLRKLSETVRQPEMIRELFRAAHSIVGSAAMLGLTDVQQIGKQFESNFKLLKEQPIAVDNRLQSLFLESFAFLRAAIVEVKTSSDPYNRDPAALPPVGDPVFEELKSYLQNLLAQIDAPTPAPVERNRTQDPAIEQVFGEYVTRKLHEIQELCLQPDRSETRAQIQQICQKLGNLGENFEFLEWANLFAACRLATANPLNSLHQLGESIGIAVKQSQILILSDRHQSVSIAPDLQALIDRKSLPDLNTSKDASTFQLDDLTANLDLETPKLASSLSSIHDEIAPQENSFGNDFENWMSESGTDIDSDLELKEFINLLGEDLPIEGTWMQDEDCSDDTLNRVDLDNLAIASPPIAAPAREVLESVLSHPAPIVVPEVADIPAIEIELPIGTVDYEEETFYDPELEDVDLATFWSDIDLAAEDRSLDSLNELDFATNSSHQFQPEHPPIHDLDIAAPDFTLDSPMSDIFIPAGTPNASAESLDVHTEIEDSSPEIDLLAVESLAQPLGTKIDLLDAPMTIGLTPDPVFCEDFDSIESPNFTSPEQHVETGLTGWIDAASDPYQIDDFVGLNSTYIEPSIPISDSAIDTDLDGFTLGAIDNLDAITDTAIDLNFADLNLGAIDSLNTPIEPSNERSFSDFDLEDFDSIDSGIDPSIGRDFSDFNSEDLNNLNSIAAPAMNGDFSDFNLDGLNNLDLEETSAIHGDFSDFNLNDLNDLNVEKPPAVASLEPNFNAENIHNLDPILTPAVDKAPTQFELEHINNLDSSAIGILALSVASVSAEVEHQSTDGDSIGLNQQINNLDLDLELPIDEPIEMSSGGYFSDFSLDSIASVDDKPFGDIDLELNTSSGGDFSDFNLDSIVSVDDRPFSAIDLEPNTSSGGDFTDFNLDSIASIDDKPFGDIDLEPNTSSGGDFTDFNLDSIASVDDKPFGDIDLEPNTSSGGDFTDFNLDSIASVDDKSFSDIDLDLNTSSGGEFTDFNLDSIASVDDKPFGDIDLELNTSSGGEFTDFNLDSIASVDDKPFGAIDLDSDLSIEGDFADFNLDSIASVDDRPFGAIDLDSDLSIEGDFANFNLADIANIDSGADSAILQSDHATDRDFADLNLADISTDLDTDLKSQLDNISSLDFNNDLSSHEFLDLAQINSEPNLPELGDLDSLLLGTAAIAIGGGLLSTMGSGFDDLDALVGTPTPVATPASSLNDLDSLLANTPPVSEPVVAKSSKKAADRRSKQRTFEQTMRVSVSHLNNLNNLVGELVVNRNTLEQDQNRMRQFIEKLFSEVQRLNDVGKRMQDLYERSLMENSLIASRQQSKAASTNQSPISAENLDSLSFMEYDPLEMDRFTPIHLLSQKMIELTVRIRESTSDIEFVVDGSTEVTRTLRQITGQLQEDLTKSRMIPFAQTADRLQRGVRENGLKYGKQVELEIEGRDTLIDKVILESLTDPLIHMVNNAIAHGIESPQTRQEFDKSPLGKISIRAIHQGNQTIISVSDDGAGINTEIVKSKAIQKGIITAKQAATMTKPEVYELLFLPSFSTKDQADELAGRGVGMDVVRTSLAEIRGTITTESQLGLGSTFTIRLPLALSIAKALIAIDNKTNIAFPMDGIEDTQDISPEQIQKNNLGENCIFWRDSLMPFKPLSDLLGFNRPLPRNNFYSTQEDDTDLVSILILRSDGNLLAVQVDKITGEQEIAIKPLQGPASKPVGIAGATVMGDGRIIPIADVMELIDLAKGKITRHISTKWAMDMPAPTTQRQESMVLIVDDSITVRELLSLTFKRAGYRVEQARDGQEAWDKLRAGLPCDIVFCDIEMPRMDGLEFLSRVQKDPALSKVPVAMLTSRGSDRHRQIASQLGASGYFIKPYLEEALLHAAKRMIEGEVLAIV